MNSMTGFGRAELNTKLGKFTTEIASVNNRFLELSVRLPHSFFVLEPKVRQLVNECVKRGKVHLFVSFEAPEGTPEKYPINRAATISYFHQLVALKKELKLNDEVKLSDLLLLPETSAVEQISLDLDRYWPSLKGSVEKALAQLVWMRQQEGRAMAADMSKRLKAIERLTRKIMARSPLAVEEYRSRLAERLKELLARPVGDQARIEEEIAVFAEKADITEECTRMISHIDQFKATMKLKGSIGKTINFILQEMNREANTVGSKTSEISITRAAIAVKDEVEKLRELVQNVE